ncbi:MAG: hypothetical protein KDC39_11915 [Actinobacteria bacterium]|nr:hypothetical protein [Actinomycetota bacterium]
MTEITTELVFLAGYAAHERGLAKPLQPATAADIADLTPIGPPLVVAARTQDLDAETVRMLAAVHGAGRSLLVVCDSAPAADLTAWLPETCWVVADSDASSVVPEPEPESSAPATPESGQAEDRLAAAMDRSTPASVLASLAEDPDASVRALVALNPSTPERTLTELATDPQIGQAVMHNENASDQARVMATLGGYEPSLLQEHIADELMQPGLWEWTTTRCSETVLGALLDFCGPERGTWQNRQQSAAFIRDRVRQDSVGPWECGPFGEGNVDECEVVRNKLACLQLDATPPDIVTHLARDDDDCVRIAAGAVMISRPNEFPPMQGERFVRQALAEPMDTTGEWEGDWEAVVRETFDFVENRCGGARADLQAAIRACRKQLLI